MSFAERMLATQPPRAAIAGVVRGRQALRRLRARTSPASAELLERTFALAEVRCLGIAAELDIAAHLARSPMSAADLAAAIGTDDDATERMLQLLAATGYFRLDRSGRWRNTRLSSVLRDEHPLSMRQWARYFGGRDMFRIWAAADTAVLTGASATTEAMGHEFFTWITEIDPAAGDRFDGAMREGSRMIGLTFAATVELDDATTIADVGGGTGQLLATTLRRHPRLQGILFELPAILAKSGPVLETAGVADRVELQAGSFFDSAPAADRLVLSAVIHDWNDDAATTILRRCREALPPGGRVLVVEAVLRPGKPPLLERHTDMQMLVLTGSGRERTDEQFRALFAAADLVVARTYTLATLHKVYELSAGP